MAQGTEIQAAESKKQPRRFAVSCVDKSFISVNFHCSICKCDSQVRIFCPKDAKKHFSASQETCKTDKKSNSKNSFF